MTDWLVPPAFTVTSTSEPGTPPTCVKSTGVGAVSSRSSPFLGTVTVTGLEDGVDSDTVRSSAEVLKSVPIMRPGASGLAVADEPDLPVEAMSTLRSWSDPMSARMPSDAEYWMDVC